MSGHVHFHPKVNRNAIFVNRFLTRRRLSLRELQLELYICLTRKSLSVRFPH